MAISYDSTASSRLVANQPIFAFVSCGLTKLLGNLASCAAITPPRADRVQEILFLVGIEVFRIGYIS